MPKQLIIIATLLLSFVGQELHAQTIGYYNSRELLMAMPEYHAAAEASKQAKARRAVQMQVLTDELNEKRQQLVLDRANLSEVMIDMKEKEIQDKEGRVNQYAAASMQEVRQLESDLLLPIHNKMGKALEKVIVANNIDQHADEAKPDVKVKKGWVDLMPMLKDELGI
jgi:outer membrane protein